jgi:hypothetical protein
MCSGPARGDYDWVDPRKAHEKIAQYKKSSI